MRNKEKGKSEEKEKTNRRDALRKQRERNIKKSRRQIVEILVHYENKEKGKIMKKGEDK